MEKKKIIISAVLGVVLYLVSTGASYAIFNSLQFSGSKEIASPLPGKQSGFRVDVSKPKTEICPINGEKYTKAEKDLWDTKRPIVAMIENHADSRPPSGISRADVVYEAVAEGGITRFMAVFYCGVQAKPVTIAPVRSARIYFIHWAQEYGDNPIFLHVGGANNSCPKCPGGVKEPGTVAKNVMAIEYLGQLGWQGANGNDFDNPGLPVFQRNDGRLDHEVATEHTMQVYIDEAYKAAEQRGWAAKDSDGNLWNKNFISWKFNDGSPTKEAVVGDIKFGFWSNQPLYDVEWKYDQQTNSYLRFNGGKTYTDLEENNVQISAKNVVVMTVEEKDEVDKEGHTFIETVGTGKATIFQNGKAIKGEWSKEAEDARTKFTDQNGKEINFVRGPIWIEAVPDYSTVTY